MIAGPGQCDCLHCCAVGCGRSACLQLTLLFHCWCVCVCVSQVIDFSSVTSMYGSVHCASQVVRRVPRRFVAQTPMANGRPEYN